jgi:hypothetical protein
VLGHVQAQDSQRKGESCPSCVVQSALGIVLQSIPMHISLSSKFCLQDFLDAVTKVIKGLSKFSATPAYMVRCVTSLQDGTCSCGVRFRDE